MRVALATCERLSNPDTDAELLVPALEAVGVEVEMPAWSDPDVDWAGFDLVQLSSTWDYHEAPEDFGRWLERAGAATRVENPPELVGWNLDKRYLRELEAAGASTIPTVWGDPGEKEAALAAARERGWPELVVKPTVDLGAMNLIRTDPDGLESAVGRMAGPFMVQPFLPSLGSEGELSLVFLEGELTHALRKRAKAGDFRVQPNWGGSAEPVEAPAEAIAIGERCLATLSRTPAAGPEAPLYARVDLVRGLEGDWSLIELELIEPLLFLVVAPEVAERFAALILARASRPARSRGPGRA